MMNSKMKRVLKIISNTLVIMVVLLTFLLYGLQLFGMRPYAVLSGSMGSVYPTGSLIYVSDVDPAALQVNDIITFRLKDGTIATHRIIEIVPDEEDSATLRFRTKGDKNDIADGALVAFEDVVGKPVFGIPYLGYLGNYISQPRGKIIAITVVVAIVLIEIMVGIIVDDEKVKNHRNQTKNEEMLE